MVSCVIYSVFTNRNATCIFVQACSPTATDWSDSAFAKYPIDVLRFPNVILCAPIAKEPSVAFTVLTIETVSPASKINPGALTTIVYTSPAGVPPLNVALTTVFILLS